MRRSELTGMYWNKQINAAQTKKDRRIPILYALPLTGLLEPTFRKVKNEIKSSICKIGWGSVKARVTF